MEASLQYPVILLTKNGCTHRVTGSHNAVKIASELQSIASKWKITEKISCIVTDNAVNMVAAVRATPWKHIPCMAHVLNLIVLGKCKTL